jgi:hypothetical protein
VEAPRRPDLADPEFDPIPVAPVRLRDFDPSQHQRLVVNPFLAVFLLMVWWFSARWLARGPFPPLSVATIIPLAFLPYAIQYHCLDCGRTSSYPRWRRHACSAVILRWNERRRPWPPFPSAKTQLVVWAYLIASATLLLIVLDPIRPGS